MAKTKQPPFLRNAGSSEWLSVDALDKLACFETLRAYGGTLFHVDTHLARLSESCLAIGQPLPVALTVLKTWLKDSLKESGFQGALLRVSVHWTNPRGGTLVVIIREFKAYPEVLYQKGVSLRTAVSRRWTLKSQDSQIKTSQFMNGVIAYLDKDGVEARHGGQAHELIFLGQGGVVAEGTVSNIFIASQKRLLTPSVSSGILRGVTRGIVIDLARKRGLEIIETGLTRHEVYSAAECFITNTSSEILPVVSVDDRSIGDGKPGAVTRMLAADFKKGVEKL